MRHATAESRFWSHTESRPNGCIEWTSSVTARGYGLFCVKRNDRWGSISAHRYAWSFYNGEIPKGAHILHTCDNRICVHPKHLYVGDHTQNMRDMVERGRVSRHSSKLTDEQAVELRELRSRGWSLRRLSERFGVSVSSVSNIANGRTYGHLSGPTNTRHYVKEARA